MIVGCLMYLGPPGSACPNGAVFDDPLLHLCHPFDGTAKVPSWSPPRKVKNLHLLHLPEGSRAIQLLFAAAGRLPLVSVSYRLCLLVKELQIPCHTCSFESGQLPRSQCCGPPTAANRRSYTSYTPSHLSFNLNFNLKKEPSVTNV